MFYFKSLRFVLCPSLFINNITYLSPLPTCQVKSSQVKSQRTTNVQHKDKTLTGKKIALRSLTVKVIIFSAQQTAFCLHSLDYHSTLHIAYNTQQLDMSAFNDYCIVCEKICTNHAVYCSDECKLRDTRSHFQFNNNVPQLISPVLQPRQDSIASMMEDDGDESDEHPSHEYLIKSPLLLSSTLKNEQSIAGLSLDNVPRESTSTPPASSSASIASSSSRNDPPASCPKSSSHDSSLAASSNYYKKWLSVSHN